MAIGILQRSPVCMGMLFARWLRSIGERSTKRFTTLRATRCSHLQSGSTGRRGWTLAHPGMRARVCRRDRITCSQALVAWGVIVIGNDYDWKALVRLINRGFQRAFGGLSEVKVRGNALQEGAVGSGMRCYDVCEMACALL